MSRSTSDLPSRPSAGNPPAPRRKGVLVALAVIGALLFASFVALGSWQVQRLGWKRDLIARVDARAHAAPASLPSRADWPRVNAADDEYRRVTATGTYRHDLETLVQAVTELGSGFWVMTPFALSDGGTVLVNRGFVSPERRERASRAANEPAGIATVTGLLRISQPKGAFLKTNDAAADRWYSRDVAAIAAARGLSDAAPFFIDADAPGNKGPARGGDAELAEARLIASRQADAVWPIGGMTIITFPNSHLVYAVTWYALALMVVVAAWFVRRDARRQRPTA
jgi:surfeit locus 1 family protein